jgi:hypothetical protein
MTCMNQHRIGTMVKIPKSIYISDIRKVMKRQYQYPEFGHTQG